MTHTRAFRKITVLIWLCFLAAPLSAGCDFPTHAFRAELSNPAQIKHLSVEVHKSRKWFKNSISILASDKQNIDDHFKRKFEATLKVRYAFGSCVYRARIRQNGDWKDHIRLLYGGNVVSSLDVRLREGNVLNAVRFKLFLPETRQGVNEILAIMILHELGHITPETFMVQTDINGISLPMLFQEKSEKELLERNLRREGPILEGDESLIWNMEGFDRFELTDISLARLTNGRWAQKGPTSLLIALEAFQSLQIPYLFFADGRRLQGFWGHHLATDNSTDLPNYYEYSLLLRLMNGWHALQPHNRKFYYNSFKQAFEPIYYDGNIRFLLEEDKEQPLVIAELAKQVLVYVSADTVAQLIERIEGLRADEKFRQAFIERSGPKGKSAETLFEPGLERLLEHLENLRIEMQTISPVALPKDARQVSAARTGLINRTINHGLSFEYFELEDRLEDGTYVGKILSGPNVGSTVELTPDGMIGVMSDNIYLDRRFVLLPTPIDVPDSKFEKQPFLDGDILISAGAGVVIDFSTRKLKVTQSSPNDWVLIRDAKIENWEITFNGAAQDPLLQSEQRFNEFGLTGCLNFYDVMFLASEITGRAGQCEDSINIVSSRGTLSGLIVEDGFADAIDIDFSQIAIDRLRVSRTGNDCFDVSTGKFEIATARLSDCGDKGISVGENSDLVAGDVIIENAVIGVSSKDFSDTRIVNLSGKGITVCAEAFQKKQEFGGGKLTIETYSCEGDIKQDANSAIVLNGLMQ